MNIEQSIDQLNEAFINFKNENNEKINQICTENSSIQNETKELQKKLEEKLHKLELKRPDLSTKNYDFSPDTKLFRNFLYHNNDDTEKKSYSSSLSIAIPTDFESNISEQINTQSAIRKFAKTIKTSSNFINIIKPKDLNIAGWGSVDPITMTDKIQNKTIKLDNIKIPLHEIFTAPKITREMLENEEQNLEEWLMNEIATEFSTLENDAFINGDGINKPRGILYFNQNSKQFDTLIAPLNNGSLDQNFTKQLIALMYSLEPKYLKNARWFMPRAMLAEIIQFQNTSTQNFIWQPPLNSNESPLLYGYPIEICDEIKYSKNEKTSLPILFGDMESTYTIVDKPGIELLKDPFTNKPLIEFYATKKVGGDITNFKSMKLLRISK